MARGARVIGVLVLLAAAVVVVVMAMVGPAPGPSDPVASAATGTPASLRSSIEGTTTATAPPKSVEATAVAGVGTGEGLPDKTPAGEGPPAQREIVADVFIWDTTMQGLGALRAIQKAADTYPVGRVVIASSSPKVTAMPAQGLAVEDLYLYNGDSLTSGMWEEFRRGALSDYRAVGIEALTPQRRLVVEPKVAQELLRWFVDGGGSGRRGTEFVCGHLVDVRRGPEGHWVVLQTASQERVRVRARVLIDGSVEGDLARKAGASYRFGTGERVFGPAAGVPPAPDGDEPSTWIQRTSALLTLRVYPGAAPPVAALDHRAYDPSAYDPSRARLNPGALGAFATSWSMRNVLPNGARELNETWNDYPYDITLPHTYVFGYDDDPSVRGRLRDQVLRYSIDRVRYLQENGYPNVGIAAVPDRLYLREGIRVVGRDTYSAEDVTHGHVRQPVAFGRYAVYDVHLPVLQDHAGVFVHVPMGSLIAADIDGLLIPGPISTDHRAYNSAVRTEPLRANVGGAAGIIAAVSLARGLPPAGVSYEEIRDELLRQGYRLGY